MTDGRTLAEVAREWQKRGVSVRTANALVWSNLYTPDDVLALGSWKRLLHVRQIGPVAAREVLVALADRLPWTSEDDTTKTEPGRWAGL